MPPSLDRRYSTCKEGAESVCFIPGDSHIVLVVHVESGREGTSRKKRRVGGLAHKGS